MEKERRKEGLDRLRKQIKNSKEESEGERKGWEREEERKGEIERYEEEERK